MGLTYNGIFFIINLFIYFLLSCAIIKDHNFFTHYKPKIKLFTPMISTKDNKKDDLPPSYETIFGSVSPNHHQIPRTTNVYQNMINKFGIRETFAVRLGQLKEYKIAYIFDDSGSMNSQLADSPLNGSTYLATRWDELKYFANISIEITSFFAQVCSVYFLNRPAIYNINNPNQLDDIFNIKPKGFTPLPRVLTQVLNEHAQLSTQKKLLVIIVTDGEPTDDKGNQDINAFKAVLSRRDHLVYTSIIACTDDDKTVEYLNYWDQELPRLDVVDDFRSEKKEVQKKNGIDFMFTFGDYVVKALLGSIDPQFDNLDG